MSIVLMTAYATTGLFFLFSSLYRLLVTDRRRERWFGTADLLLLGGVALLSSAAWVLLLPVYGAGWLRSPEGHRQRERIRSFARPRRARRASVTVGC